MRGITFISVLAASMLVAAPAFADAASDAVAYSNALTAQQTQQAFEMQQQQAAQQAQQFQLGTAGIQPYCNYYGTCPSFNNQSSHNYFNPGGILTPLYRSAGLFQLGDEACPATTPTPAVGQEEPFPAYPPSHHRHHRRHRTQP